MVENTEYTVCDCSKCPELAENRTQIVNGVGPKDAEILFVGEAPGENEDQQGEPFVGRSGGILDDALEQAGASRDQVRITNTVRCRPPDNRDPRKDEQDNCFPFLRNEILAVDPSVIVPVGKVPSEQLTNEKVRITDEAGEQRTITIEEQEYTVQLCPHPAAIFYNRTLESVFYDVIQNIIAEHTNN